MNEHALLGIKGPVMVSCAAPYGVGGLGRHVKEIFEFCRGRGLETEGFKTPSRLKWMSRMASRISPAWGTVLEATAFDTAVAKALPRGKTFIGFNGYSLASMKAARERGYESVFLAVAMAHINLTAAQARKGWEYAPVEPLGYIADYHQQFLKEYDAADRILYATDYIRRSFLKEKFPAEKLERFDLSTDPRFKRTLPKSGKNFVAVAVGGLNCLKGTPVLLDAFAKFNDPKAELILVGGSGTRQMRKYLERRLAADSRVRLAPGDPLPHLLEANVLVHASFQDGFGYAPMEAMACGVPVIVTEHTGMKEFVREGENGWVVPAGDPEAILGALKKVAR